MERKGKGKRKESEDREKTLMDRRKGRVKKTNRREEKILGKGKKVHEGEDDERKREKRTAKERQNKDNFF